MHASVYTCGVGKELEISEKWSKMMSKLPYLLRGLLEPVGVISQVPELLLELDRDRDQRTAAMGRNPFVYLFKPLVLLPDEAVPNDGKTGRQTPGDGTYAKRGEPAEQNTATLGLAKGQRPVRKVGWMVGGAKGRQRRLTRAR